MKVFVCLFAVLAVSQATVDWDNLQPANLNPISNRIPDFDQNNFTKIVGGEEVVPHSRAFQAGLFVQWNNGQQVFCGGSLISSNFILTAAHCVTATTGVRSVEVVLGAHNIREEEPSQVRLTSSEFIVHPRWSMALLANDIALIRLPEPVVPNENIAIVALPSRSDEGDRFTGKTATVSGWGKDRDSATSISDVLRQTSNPVISRLKCSLSFPIIGLIIRESHLCVSGRRGHSSCNGDSGGPLTVESDRADGVPIQVGVVSFGNGAGCSLRFPHVYTRITEFLDWIEENSDVVIVQK